jgi:hypothetical protein
VKTAPQALDLRKLSVADLITALTRGAPWAWKLMAQLVATSATVARKHARGLTPAPMPALVQTKEKT